MLFLLSLTVAVTIVTDSNGAAEEAGGPAEVAGAGVSDVVIATYCLLRECWDWARSCATHNTMSTIGLVSHTGVGTWTHHVVARLCAKHEDMRTISKEEEKLSLTFMQ